MINTEVASFTSSTLGTLTIFAILVVSFFLVKGGYLYITSSGRPDVLESAKKTILNAFIGLILVISANTLISFLTHSFIPTTSSSLPSQLSLTPIEPAVTNDGLAQVLISSITALLQNLIQSATKPITSGIIGFLTVTPQLASNLVIFNFWLIIVGVTYSLFALLVAILGFQFMSATTFGFEELELKRLLPRIGLAFLAANTSIFLIDFVIQLANNLISAMLHATGGLNQAWIVNAFNPTMISLGGTALITLIFMVVFVILAIVLLLFYISRLIAIVVGACLSPLIFLLWAFPKFSDFAEISAKTYLVTIFSIFVHVVILQLASSFLTLPGQTGTNSLISILIGIGLLFSLLKTQSFMMQLVFYNTNQSMIKKIGGQIMNVVSTKEQVMATSQSRERFVRAPRRAVNV